MTTPTPDLSAAFPVLSGILTECQHLGEVARLGPLEGRAITREAAHMIRMKDQAILMLSDMTKDLSAANTRIAELEGALRDMPECQLQFQNKADMDAWNAWKARYSALLDEIDGEQALAGEEG